MKYFSNDFTKFFKELKSNNQKEWFHANKKRYEAEVKKPFAKFVSDLIQELGKYEELNVQAKDCILRINRDIRFSKDKTPYNTHVTAIISKAGRKDKSIPGLYIRLSPDMIGIMGGCYGPDKDQLARIRNTIAQDPKAFQKIISEKSFASKFGEIKGDSIKRVPKEYKEAAETEPLILKKHFYYMAEESPALISSDKLLPSVLEYYQVMKPVNDFFTKAILS